MNDDEFINDTQVDSINNSDKVEEVQNDETKSNFISNSNQAMVASATQRYLEFLNQNTPPPEDDLETKMMGFAKVSMLAIITALISLGIILFGVFLMK